ncbi:MAG TPA: type II secretion system protein GspF, partial [Myxococcota bacterium]
MPVYAFKGVNSAGKSINGLLDAETSRSARGKLRKDGIYLTELAEQRGVASVKAAAGRSFQLPSFSRIPPLELALATRQAATLLSSGIPLVEGLS